MCSLAMAWPRRGLDRAGTSGRSPVGYDLSNGGNGSAGRSDVAGSGMPGSGSVACQASSFPPGQGAMSVVGVALGRYMCA